MPRDSHRDDASSRLPRRASRGLALLLAMAGALLFADRALHAADATIDLGGAWSFAIDPLDRGEAQGWARADGTEKPAVSGWDQVNVPHDFLADPRYAFTGCAWYRRSFKLPPATGESQAWRLRFEQVSQRCRVWLNGQLVGAHDGGYTPFEYVVTPLVRQGGTNVLVVAVDNRIRLRGLPGARSGTNAPAQVYPWLNYGGILGAVTLVGHAPVYVVRQQVLATPDLSNGSTTVVTRVAVRNDTAETREGEVSAAVPGAVTVSRTVALPAHSEQMVELTGELPATAVKRWTLDAQPLYTSRVVIRSAGREHSIEDAFGIRTLEARGGQFRLNGVAVRLGGANRARGHAKFGGRDPDEAVQEDMALMKAAGLRFARLQHTPPHANLLDWADRNGMLLVLEVGVWGYPAADLASAELRNQFKAEMAELVALAANHPSVVGWSVGNEYESWTPEGVAWTVDMAAYMKTLDPSRLVTFAALGRVLRELRDRPAAGPHAFDAVDLISTNVYFSPEEAAALLDPVHARWPDKPVLISEFGLRADRTDEPQRIAHFDKMLALVRERPWICGLSYWSFNDYASHYPGTGADGYRRWGLVDEFRRPRPLYEHVRQRIARGLDETKN